MADTASSSRTSSNNGSSRRGRAQGVSRNSSARSSAVYPDDYLQPPGYGAYAGPALRSTSSRFSLHEQFAATRRDYEFGFDDGTSIFERSTLASESIDEEVSDDSTLLGPVSDLSSALQRRGGIDYYDLLVLPPNPSPLAIRRAYYRLFVLLYPDSHPPRSRSAARVYFELVQTAFETLIDPDRRLAHHLDACSTFGPSPESNSTPSQHKHHELLRYLVHEQVTTDHGSLDLGIRLNDGLSSSSSSSGGSSSRLKPLDFSMSQTIATPLPDPEQLLSQAAQKAAALAALLRSHGLLRGESEIRGRLTQPTSLASQRTFLVVKGSVYGLLEDLISLPAAVLADPHHPCIPTYVPRGRAMQLLDGRAQPRVAVKIQHELQPATSGPGVPGVTCGSGTIVELESEILPDPAIAVGVSKAVTIPRDSKQSLVQVSTRCLGLHRSFPRVGVVLLRPWSSGFIQCKLESGDWLLRPDQTSHAFTQFSAINERLLGLSSSLRLAPRVEISYSNPSSLESPTTFLSGPSREQSLRSLDTKMGRDGSNARSFWALSTAAEPHCLGASLKYSVDAGVLSSRLAALVMGHPTADTMATHFGRGVRLEAELASNTIWSRFIAVRCLRQAGRLSKVGFEIGVSTYNLHLALYWSRLGQGIRLPILVFSGPNVSPRLLFWTTVVPFVGLATWEYVRCWRGRAGLARRVRSQAKEIQERRAEADDLAILLSLHVDSRQEVERERRGLVILSAKYGVKTGVSWELEEVADVTTAVAALVDDGQLHIPSNVVKSNILGFWDPVPHATKTLHVRYMFQGKEGTVEVVGQEPLSLPLRARPRELV